MALLKNIAAVMLGLLIALGLGEVISRVFLPIFPGSKYLALDGEELSVGRLTPGIRYRQFSEEFDALTTITADGYRVPDGQPNPAIVFIGDSFTFGVGLADEETFTFVACTVLAVSCANLGEPGASTRSALDRLDSYLRRHDWRPQQVYLFMLAMTGFLGAGNDLFDNLKAARRAESATSRSAGSDRRSENGPSDRDGFVLSTRSALLAHSNLVRVIKFYLGPTIKSLVAPAPGESLLQQALDATRKELHRLQSLSERYGFAYQVFVVHPVQDISRGTYKDTLEKLQAISPRPIVPTAQLFLPNPRSYYFPLDGHLNAAGSRKLAQLVVATYRGGGRRE